ncbi:MAG: cyclophilin-like fold protein [Christensenellaceae bacterium]|jgi:hypothetical protein
MKRNHLFIIVCMLLLFCNTACKKADPLATENTASVSPTQASNNLEESPTQSISLAPSEAPSLGAETDNLSKIILTIGSTDFSLFVYENETTAALIREMPFSLDFSDYAGQEKVTTFPNPLPGGATTKPDTIRSGELYLWSGNSLVLFYTTFQNSYGGYIPLGYLENQEGFLSALGAGDVNISFRLAA